MLGTAGARVAGAQHLEGGQQVVGEDGGPAEEEHRHDQDQHVDHFPGLSFFAA